jgi:hypothetical protein
MGGITHIVQITFKTDVSAGQIKEVSKTSLAIPIWITLTKNKTCDRMIGLQNKCIHPTTQKQYIRSSKGGKDCSIEGLQVREIFKTLLSNPISLNLSCTNMLI